ncbi:hypothetical protein NSERUTF1_3434 [Nocardia seriolae]|nr:hypothetical protein NSERUTF1_3434 [Nocardia seriolae]
MSNFSGAGEPLVGATSEIAKDVESQPVSISSCAGPNVRFGAVEAVRAIPFFWTELIRPARPK